LNNEYRVGDIETAIPPTLLATAVAPVDNTQLCPTTPLKKAGNLIVLLGTTTLAGGGAVAAEFLEIAYSQVPCPDFNTAPALFDALYQAILAGHIASCHDLAEGGLAVAAAEMVMGSELSCTLDLNRIPGYSDLVPSAAMFAETPTRFLLEVAPDSMDALGEFFRVLPWAAIGEVTHPTAEPGIQFLQNGTRLHEFSTSELLQANGVQS
jgi:phosphoribosylformylglycinamidine synthase